MIIQTKYKPHNFEKIVESYLFKVFKQCNYPADFSASSYMTIFFNDGVSTNIEFPYYAILRIFFSEMTDTPAKDMDKRKVDNGYMAYGIDLKKFFEKNKNKLKEVCYEYFIRDIIYDTSYDTYNHAFSGEDGYPLSGDNYLKTAKEWNNWIYTPYLRNFCDITTLREFKKYVDRCSEQDVQHLYQRLADSSLMKGLATELADYIIKMDYTLQIKYLPESLTFDNFLPYFLVNSEKQSLTLGKMEGSYRERVQIVSEMEIKKALQSLYLYGNSAIPLPEDKGKVDKEVKLDLANLNKSSKHFSVGFY